MTTATLSREWIEFECGIDWSSGDISGDSQVGDSCSRMFKRERRDGKWDVAVAYYAVVDLRERFPGNDYGDTPYDVEETIELSTIANRDDHVGEVGETQHEYVNYMGYDSAAKAREHVRRNIESFDAARSLTAEDFEF